jgi:hypothetical protein
MSMVVPKPDHEAEVMNPAEQRPEGSDAAPGRSRPRRSEESGASSAIDPAVLRDIRHSIGNRFHKLYYWAELLGGTTEPEKRAEHLQGLVDGMRGLQDEVEASLRYCEPESCVPMAMPLEHLIEAVDRLLGSELPGVDIDVVPLAGTRPVAVWLDPQLFSQALRNVLGLLGGTQCESLTCRFDADPAGSHLEIWIATLWKDRNEEDAGSLLEWALAAKALHTQGGGLRPLGAGPSTVEGCVFALALRN